MNKASDKTSYHNTNSLSQNKELSAALSDAFWPITVAEYIALELNAAGIDVLFCSLSVHKSYLSTVAQEILSNSVVLMNSPRDAVYASIAYTKNSGIGCFLITEDELLPILHDLILLAEEKTPIISIILTSIGDQEFSPLSHHENMRKKILQHVKKMFEGFLGSYLFIHDRRTAGARIDRTFDVVRELSLSVVLEISEEVSHSFLPPHIYRKTIFNHEEHDLFLNTWATIFSRLHHATAAPAIVIGQQIRKKEWISILVKIAHHWDASLFLESEIAGILLSEEIGQYTSICNNPRRVYELMANHDALFCFGLESDHIWLTALFEEIALQEENCHDFMSINADSLFFCDGKEPFQVFSLENFFQAIPEAIEIELKREKNHQRRAPLYQSQDRHSSSLEKLEKLLYISNKQLSSLILLDLQQKEIDYFQTTIHHITMWKKPKNSSESWIKAMMLGILEARNRDTILFATADSQIIENIATWWNRRYENYPEVKLLLILISDISTKSPHLLANTIFLKNMSELHAWLKIDGETFSSGFISLSLSD